MTFQRMHEAKGLVLVSSLVLMAPVFALAEERVCVPVESDTRNYEVRWQPGQAVELRGQRYSGSAVHWNQNGGWRTGSSFHWTAGFDDQGIHRIYEGETRYEYDPDSGQLFHHIMKRLASPEAESSIRRKKYDHSPPAATPGRVPIQTSGLEEGTTHSMYVADCSAVEDGSLKLASDYSILDIIILYFRDALQKERHVPDQ